MIARPILFSAPMVRALLDGSKTQTRRVCKPAANLSEVVGIEDPREIGQRPLEVAGSGWFGDAEGEVEPFFCPYGKPGDRLWVREAHSIYPTHGQHRADGERWGPWGGLPTTVSADGKQIAYYREGFDRCDPGRWRPSIHMPRWASRILLEITGVRVERLQDISEADARAEGITDGGCLNCGNSEANCGCLNPKPDARDSFIHLWKSINGDDSWDANPWVWCVEFRRLP